jgi:hypothetical protein
MMLAKCITARPLVSCSAHVIACFLMQHLELPEAVFWILCAFADAFPELATIKQHESLRRANARFEAILHERCPRLIAHFERLLSSPKLTLLWPNITTFGIWRCEPESALWLLGMTLMNDLAHLDFCTAAIAGYLIRRQQQLIGKNIDALYTCLDPIIFGVEDRKFITSVYFGDDWKSCTVS